MILDPITISLQATVVINRTLVVPKNQVFLTPQNEYLVLRGSDVSVLSATAPAAPIFLPGPAPLPSRAVNGPQAAPRLGRPSHSP